MKYNTSVLRNAYIGKLDNMVKTKPAIVKSIWLKQNLLL